MYTQDYSSRSGHPVKTTLTLIFLILSTLSFLLTATIGAATASRIFFDVSLSLADGIALAVLIIYFVLLAVVTATLAITDFIFGAVLMKCARGRAHGIGKVAVIFNTIYVLLPLVYALIMYFV